VVRGCGVGEPPAEAVEEIPVGEEGAVVHDVMVRAFPNDPEGSSLPIIKHPPAAKYF